VQQDRTLSSSTSALFEEKEREMEHLRRRMDSMERDAQDKDVLFRAQTRDLVDARNEAESFKRLVWPLSLPM
jgi:hypothetical protein